MKNEMLISGLTGVTSQIITWPTEFLKTNKQLPKYKNTNIFTVVKNEFKINGIKTFYRGSMPQIASAFPRSIVRFNTYNTTNEFLNKYNSTSFLNKVICGILGGSTEALFVQTPAEVIKIQCINNKQNPTDAIKTIFTRYGFKGFWHGSGPTIIRQGSSQGISFPVFNIMKPYFNNYDLTKSYSSLFSGVCGGISAVLINNPIDAIKTYKQSDFKQNSILEITKTIHKTKGIKGFYKGMELRLLRMAPLHGCTFYFYDLFKKYL